MLAPERAARLTPSAFARYVTQGRYALPRHLAYMERVLVEVAAGRKKRVAVAVPPRHGKSFMCSRYFLAWYLGNFPDKRVILASYEADFAAQWGRDVRDLLTEHGPQLFGVRVRQDSSAANRWSFDGRTGGMQTAGAGGPVLGKGADILLIDDPIKNYEEAHSETIREKIWNWYRGVAFSRLEPNAAIVVVQQRTHEQDLIGRIVDEIHNPGIETWEVINFPAIAEENDALGRKPGEALWPERYNEEYLRTASRIAAPYLWASMWQQRPSPPGGGLFKRECARRYRLEDGIYRFLEDGSYSTRDLMQRFVTVDTATSEKEAADLTAIAAWGVTARGRLVLLDLDMRRIEAPKIVDAIQAMKEKWDCVAWIEDNPTSKHLLQFMQASGLIFRTLEAGTRSKFVRAIPASALWEQGRLVLPDQAAWLEAYERQLFAFSEVSGGHDDAVDVTGYAAQVMLELSGKGPEAELHKPRSILPKGYEASRPAGF